MATLITAADFRGRFDISEDIVDGRITPNIGSASRRLRKWVGETNYQMAVVSPATEMAEDLKNAEAHLTFHFAIFGFNSPLSSKGVVATSASSEGREMRKYLLPKESRELAENYLELAMEMAGPYMPDDGSTTFELVTEDGGAEASTRMNGGSCC
ncbi:MAG: hypothetical protein ABI539_15175 [Acidobacteriota bacterium]